MRKVLRRAGIGLGSLVLLVLVLAAGLHVAGGRKLARTFDVPAATVAAPVADEATIARGRHLATAIGKCAACHGPDLGGNVMIDDPALGRAVAANLTRGRGGLPADWSIADWDRAIRHGVRRDGTGLVIMPSQEYTYMSDEDLAALAAYLETLAPVDRELPPTQIRLVGRALYVADKMPLVPAALIDHEERPPAPLPGPTAEYGRYLANIGGCTGCHYPNLAGGPALEPGAPPASNLTPGGIGSWTEADFARALRDGVRPDGSRLKEFMPVEFTKLMTDDEIRAVFLYLQTLPAKRFGER